ncbi:DUF2318 domain-containing protein, partial [Candidatus Woesearchaeota archaeon]|nr:DUF2318 domain-containing protein [Candidatus Woesearchaeota archaeon]
MFLLIITGCSDKNQTTGNIVCNTESSCDTDDQDYEKIPVSDITGSLKKFSYEHEGTMIKYFAVRAQDGNIRTAFDACDVCGGHKGYRQNGNDVICNNC